MIAGAMLQCRSATVSAVRTAVRTFPLRRSIASFTHQQVRVGNNRRRTVHHYHAIAHSSYWRGGVIDSYACAAPHVHVDNRLLHTTTDGNDGIGNTQRPHVNTATTSATTSGAVSDDKQQQQDTAAAAIKDDDPRYRYWKKRNRVYKGPSFRHSRDPAFDAEGLVPLPHFIFAGRTNVGKSLLISNLLGKKNIARASSVAGKTDAVNTLVVNDEFALADFPGHGEGNAGDPRKTATLHVDREWRRVWRPLAFKFIARCRSGAKQQHGQRVSGGDGDSSGDGGSGSGGGGGGSSFVDDDDRTSSSLDGGIGAAGPLTPTTLLRAPHPLLGMFYLCDIKGRPTVEDREFLKAFQKAAPEVPIVLVLTKDDLVKSAWRR